MKAFESLGDEIKSRMVCFTVGGEDSTISDAEYILTPKVAL